MSDPEKKLQELLNLKRYEKPREGYFEDFLEEFQSRQRSELLHRSSTGLFLERVSTWFREVGPIKWFAGAGFAYAVLMAIILFWPGRARNSTDPNLAPASHEPAASDRKPVLPPAKSGQLPTGPSF